MEKSASDTLAGGNSVSEVNSTSEVDTPKIDTPTKSALFLSAFFDELIRLDVYDVVISPGSRSTPLALIAFQSELQHYIDIDERGAAFFALGLAKASGKPVCLICTSGTAPSNYYPALLEAYTSRIPLIVLTADRPPHLQNLGAPQTCDQIKMFGDAVRHFQQMPLPDATKSSIAFARQMARTACIHAIGTPCFVDDEGNYRAGVIGSAGPVHFNFPFDEPLMPNLQAEGMFEIGCSELDERRGFGERRSSDEQVSGKQEIIHEEASSHKAYSLPGIFQAQESLNQAQVVSLAGFMKDKRGIVLCGEGSVSSESQTQELLAWAERFGLPLIADPLSSLRQYDHPLVLDAYGNIFGKPECPDFDYLIRFGQYPVSKRCFNHIGTSRPLQIVVDACDTRDFNAATDTFIRCSPAAFVRSFADLPGNDQAQQNQAQQDYVQKWIALNAEQRERISSVMRVEKDFEGAFVFRIVSLAPADSLIFSANSMAIRMLDTFLLKANRKVDVLCNRGLNGIDGTVSTALGAAQYYDQTTFMCGDLTLLHDISALALQTEILVHQAEKLIEGGLTPQGEGSTQAGSPQSDGSDLTVGSTQDQGSTQQRDEFDHRNEKITPSIIIVLFNNQGGGIFDMLPQKSEEEYFDRLFVTEQQVDFAHLARGFKVPHYHADEADEAARIYENLLGTPGISLLEITVPLSGLMQRYDRFL